MTIIITTASINHKNSYMHKIDITTSTKRFGWYYECLQQSLSTMSTLVSGTVLLHAAVFWRKSEICATVVQGSCWRISISSSTACFLQISLHIRWSPNVDDTSDVGAIQAHPKGHCSHNNAQYALRIAKVTQNLILYFLVSTGCKHVNQSKMGEVIWSTYCLTVLLFHFQEIAWKTCTPLHKHCMSCKRLSLWA